MSNAVKPLGAAELKAVQAHARYFAFHGPDHTFTSKGAAAEMLRLCATVRQLEQGLAAVTAERDAERNACGIAQAERDAYKAVVDGLLAYEGLESTIGLYRGLAEDAKGIEMSPHHPGGFCWSAYFDRMADALEGLPQPSGNSGGFAAAAGILANTWDGEPSEVAIRRLRDGTPPAATTKPISETRMGEPNAIDAEEEGQ